MIPTAQAILIKVHKLNRKLNSKDVVITITLIPHGSMTTPHSSLYYLTIGAPPPVLVVGYQKPTCPSQHHNSNHDLFVEDMIKALATNNNFNKRQDQAFKI